MVRRRQSYMLVLVVLVVYLCLTVVTARKHLHKLKHRIGKKLKEYYKGNEIEYYFLPPILPFKESMVLNRKDFEDSDQHAIIERRNMHHVDDTTIFDGFGKTAPILWENDNTVEKPSLTPPTKKSHSSKKDGGDLTEENIENEMPNTVNPNPNIYGGFPENDIWGNFELPAPETIDKLKLALKMNHHRPNYGSDQASDSNDQLYGYEHHALPEYDILETPAFHKGMWQNAQLIQAMKGLSLPSGECNPGMGSCPPIHNKPICENVKEACANAVHPGLKAPEYEAPCAAKILSLFGCGGKTEASQPKPQEHPSFVVPPPIEGKEEPKIEAKPELDPKIQDALKDAKEEFLKLGQKLTSEDNGAVHDSPKSKDEMKVPESTNNINVAKLIKSSDDLLKESKNINKFTGKQSNDNDKDSSLFSEDDSMSLISALGQDLQTSLMDKLKNSPDSNKNTKRVDFIASKSKPDNDKTKTKNATSNKSTVNTDNKTLSMYFDSMKPKTERHEGAQGFTEWSNWSSCSSCPDNVKTRKRRCLKSICNGTIEEKAICSEKPCNDTSGKVESEGHGLSIKEKELLEAIQPAGKENNTADIDEKSQEEILLNSTFNKVVSSFTNDLSNDSQSSTEAKKIFELLTKKLYAQNVLPEVEENDSKLSQSNKMSEKEEIKLEKDTASQQEEANEISGKLQEFEDIQEKGNKESNDSVSDDDKINTTSIQGSNTAGIWGEWSICSQSCGIGSSVRNCLSGNCKKKSAETKICHNQVCPDPSLEAVMKDGCLKMHNEFRKRHGANTLEWSHPLYQKAYEITDRIAMNNITENNIAQYERPGLNLGFVKLNLRNNRSLETPCIRGVEEWYGQKLNYNYETPKLTADDRDFTQLVWKSTKRVGLARSYSMDKKYAYVAAVYEPVGNVDSYYDLKKTSLPKYDKREGTLSFLNRIMQMSDVET